MSHQIAAWSRVLQFRSGPQEHRFYACDDHRDLLSEDGQPLFFATDDEPITPIDHNPDEDQECDFCREG